MSAWLLQPALFLHFVLTFPEKRNFVRKHRWIIPAIYVPGMLLLGIHIFALRLLKASERLRWNLDRMQMGYLALFFVVAAGVLVVQLPPGQHADPAAAAQVGHARHHSRHRALHAVLRDPLPDGRAADRRR